MNRKPNLNQELVQQLLANIGEHEWVDDHVDDKQHGSYPKDTVNPMDVLDYVYAVLHSPSYREKYQEFLKIDFPRVPPATDANSFWKLVELGSCLRQLHLMDTSVINDYDTTFPIAGSNEVEKISYTKEKVYINSEQYFGNVPEIAWSFYIGGYQPAQKWLKDRKGHKLSSDNLDHYQRIIKILLETDKTMKEIDKVWQP